MRYFLASAAVAAALAMSPAAFAASQTATGSIKSYDAKSHTIVLNDGAKYVLPASVKASDMKAGTKVQISWTMKGKDHDATAVKILN